MIVRRTPVALVALLVAASSLACQSRQRRPIQQAAPQTGTAANTNTGGTGGTTAGQTPGPGGEVIAGGQNDQTQTTGADPNPQDPAGTAGTGNGNTNVTLETQLEGQGGASTGQTASTTWDGKSFKGNDKWDVTPIQ